MKRNRSNRICSGVILCFVLLFACVLHVQSLEPGKKTSQYILRVWNTRHGLPSNAVFALQQTRNGYLWIGTQEGLTRFDGHRFETYDKKKKTGLKCEDIRALCECSSGTLWIGTATGGLTALKNGEFTHCPYGGNTKPGALTTENPLYGISAIREDKEGNLWIGTFKNGLTLLNPRTMVYQTYTAENGLPGNRVRTIYKDDAGDLWITTTRGIVKLIQPGVFQVQAIQPKSNTIKTTALFENETGEIWYGTAGKGLFRVKNQTVSSYHSGEKSLPPIINSLFRDSAKNLWVGTDGGGLIRINQQGEARISKSSGLACNYIYSIYEDRENNLWIGTVNGGLHQLRDSVFTGVSVKHGLSPGHVNALLQDRQGVLWIGGKNGLSSMENDRVTIRYEKELAGTAVMCLYQDRSGPLWVGTWQGVYRIDGNGLTRFTTENGLTDNRIKTITPDKDGNAWIGTKNGLNRCTPGNGAITNYTKSDGLPGNDIEYLFADSRGTLWICTGSGLATMTGKTIILHNLGKKNGRETVFCAYEDAKGVLWFGTNNGLIRKEKNKITRYGEQNGLPGSYVYSILEDDKGKTWLAGRKGITCLFKKELTEMAAEKNIRLHPVQYDETDGMPSRWCTGRGIKTSDGKHWYPTSSGIARIDPNRIPDRQPPPVLMEKIIADGETIQINGLGKGTPTVPLQLHPGKKRIHFYYTALTFITPGKTEFRVKLDGFDGQWQDMGTHRFATYTGLAPGTYTFRVTLRGSDGQWSGTNTAYTFQLLPFFYQTPWFYFCLVIVVITGTYLLYRFRVRQMTRRQEELEQHIHFHTGELKERNAQLEKGRQQLQQSKEIIEEQNRQLQRQSEELAELDKAKTRFFTDISHEFRTPLTLIQGPLAQILEETPGQNQDTRLKIMMNNADRLLDLVNQLLELAKLDSGKMQLKAVRQNIVPFLRYQVMCFESAALQKGVELHYRAEAQDITLYFDPEKIERIITNLLSNALKFTPQKGGIAVTVRAASGTAYPVGCIEISVRDNGIGIPRRQLPHIFERFYRGEKEDETNRQGTGVGLSLCKELIRLHHGDIEVHSNVESDHRGTEFIFRLPIGKDHLQPGDIAETPLERRKHSRVTKGESMESERAENNETDYETDQPGDPPIILVVDDNADMRAYVRMTLEKQYRVIDAENGKEGMEKAIHHIPDLIVSDVMMPVVDGIVFSTGLKSDIKTSHIPIILLTAKAAEEDLAEGLKTGADAYITKPFRSELLLIRVRNLIDQRERLRQKYQRDMMLKPDEVVVTSVDTEFIKEMQTVIEANLSDTEFGVEGLAEKLYMSQSTLYRKIEAITGENTRSFIRDYRLQRGAQMLKQNYGNVTDVAFAVGFSSTAYFAKCFKEKFNLSPKAYKGKTG